MSPLNLNNEFGEVEKPYNPVIRGSAPLFSEHGDLLGIVVINYDAKELLKSLNQELNSSLYIVDDQANYLSNSSNRSREFEKFITPDKEAGFEIDHPETWNLLDSNQSIINDDEGFWIAEKLDFKEATSHLNLVKGG